MINSDKLYKIAYDAHYDKQNISVAYLLYQEIIGTYPDSVEFGYAKTQIKNIETGKATNFNTNTITDYSINQAKIIANGEKDIAEYGDELDKKVKAIYEERHIINSLRENMMLTTGFSFDGYSITKYVDVLFDEMIIGVGLKTSIKAIGDVFSNIMGEEHFAISERLKEVKKSLRDRLIGQATAIGANALIGIDFESSISFNGAIMVSMTATAVFIDKIEK